MNKRPNRQLFRHAILLQLEAATPASLPVDTLQHGLRLAGHECTEEGIGKEIAYLEDKGLLATRRLELGQDTPRYRLTADGRDYLERQGLA